MQYATPGVYIKERNAFTNSVVAVPTAVPAFIGYTEKAVNGTTSLKNVPTRITSLAEYVTVFGGPPRIQFNIKGKSNLDFDLKVEKQTQYLLFNSIRLFFCQWWRYLLYSFHRRLQEWSQCKRFQWHGKRRRPPYVTCRTRTHTDLCTGCCTSAKSRLYDFLSRSTEALRIYHEVKIWVIRCVWWRPASFLW